MAESGGLANLLKWGVLIGGGYYLYNLFTSNPGGAPLPAPVAGGAAPSPVTTQDLINALHSSPGAGSSSAPTGGGTAGLLSAADLVAQLKAAALQAGYSTPTMRDDQWDYFRNMIYPPALTPDQFASAFPAPSGQITAEQFVAALQGKGLAGLGEIKRRPFPVVLQTPRGRVVRWI